MSYAVKPIGEQFLWLYGRCFAGQNQKGRLKGVLGIVMVANDTTANAEDHRAVAMNEDVKGRFVLLLDEGSQQLPIRLARSVLLGHGPAKMPEHRI